MEKEQIIEIQEDVKLPGTDILLEKGDKIKILTEMGDRFRMADMMVQQMGIEDAWNSLIMDMTNEEFSEKYNFIMGMY